MSFVAAFLRRAGAMASRFCRAGRSRGDVFTWAIHHPGDIEAAAEGYYKDSERIELEILARYVTDWKVSTVTQEPVP